MESKITITKSKLQELFQKRVGYLMGLLEVSNNQPLKKEVKNHLWELCDLIINNNEEVKDETKTNNFAK
jgi:hypothetical protein